MLSLAKYYVNFAVFLPASLFILTSPFINFGNFHPPRFLFWPKFASLPVYSALSFYLKLENIEVKIKLNFYFHTPLWCLGLGREGLGDPG